VRLKDGELADGWRMGIFGEGSPVGREFEGLWFGPTAFLRRKHSEFDRDHIGLLCHSSR
jgi:hypothetical protein